MKFGAKALKHKSPTVLLGRTLVRALLGEPIICKGNIFMNVHAFRAKNNTNVVIIL